MPENNENIKITVVEKRGKRGCDYCHRVGDVYDYAKDAGRLCPWMLTVANMYISKLKDGHRFIREGLPRNAVTFCCPDPRVMNIFQIEYTGRTAGNKDNNNE
ncbi:MAG: TIGR04076 family protein [Succinimonas sp.]|nr:TIGR04076 family protein [Succinimonas sp.]